MKLKLKLQFATWDSYEDRKLSATTETFDNDYRFDVREVTVEIPDDVDFTEKEFNDAIYMKNLSAAEKIVKKKRDELYRAEEVVKNMLALTVEVEK